MRFPRKMQRLQSPFSTLVCKIIECKKYEISDNNVIACTLKHREQISERDSAASQKRDEQLMDLSNVDGIYRDFIETFYKIEQSWVQVIGILGKLGDFAIRSRKIQDPTGISQLEPSKMRKYQQVQCFRELFWGCCCLHSPSRTSHQLNRMPQLLDKPMMQMFAKKNSDNLFHILITKTV